jgi:hypothetical protein
MQVGFFVKSHRQRDMIRLDKRSIEKLRREPESGMGYQNVEVEYSDHQLGRGIAYNAQLVVFEDEKKPEFKAGGFESVLEATRESTTPILEVRVVATKRASAVSEKTATDSSEAKDAPLTATARSEEFKRFSAYAADIRLLPNGSWAPSTYATTAADAVHVKTGSQAVARYALPTPTPATNVFTSRPHAGTPIKRGTVAPAFGQPGGGVEVIFPTGTQAGTTTGPVSIPP